MRLEMMKAFAKSGGDIALRFYKKTRGRRKPGNKGIVTDADEQIEDLLRRRISEVYPDERILGEEHGELNSNSGSDELWAIDPIDGTSAFAAGLPLWAVSVGLVRSGIPELGVLVLPAVSEVYWAGPDGVFLNNKPCKMSGGTDSFDSESFFLIPSNSHRNYTIDFPGKARSMGSIAVHLAYVASGIADGALIGRPYIWDIAAAAVMILRQGGVFLTLDGNQANWNELIKGKRSPEPLVAGPEKSVRAFIKNVSTCTDVIDY